MQHHTLCGSKIIYFDELQLLRCTCAIIVLLHTYFSFPSLSHKRIAKSVFGLASPSPLTQLQGYVFLSDGLYTVVIVHFCLNFSLRRLYLGCFWKTETGSRAIFIHYERLNILINTVFV